LEQVRAWFYRIDINAPVILGFALICALVLFLGYLTQDASTLTFFSVYRSSVTDPYFFIRLFGHVFGHANLPHFYGNMLILLLVGPLMEEKYGAKKLLSMMAVTALITGIFNMLLFPYALLGSSGIVFMLIVLSSFVNYRAGKIPLTLLVIAVMYIGQEFFTGLRESDNISQLTHVLGGLCGGVFGYLLHEKKIEL
jgi:rhomboid protease GluP